MVPKDTYYHSMLYITDDRPNLLREAVNVLSASRSFQTTMVKVKEGQRRQN